MALAGAIMGGLMGGTVGYIRGGVHGMVYGALFGAATGAAFGVGIFAMGVASSGALMFFAPQILWISPQIMTWVWGSVFAMYGLSNIREKFDQAQDSNEILALDIELSFMLVTWLIGTYKLGKSQITDETILPKIRAKYDEGATNIKNMNETWKNQGISAKERSKMAFAERQKVIDNTRDLMTEEFSLRQIQIREFLKYGNTKGATYEQLFTKYLSRGCSEETAYENIISSATRTNESVNLHFIPRNK
jgi:hypothetical protein